jgi:hypothetical protein
MFMATKIYKVSPGNEPWQFGKVQSAYVEKESFQKKAAIFIILW